MAPAGDLAQQGNTIPTFKGIPGLYLIVSLLTYKLTADAADCQLAAKHWTLATDYMNSDIWTCTADD